MRFIAAFIVSALIIAGGVVLFAYSGLYDVSATSPHRGPVAWLLSTTSHASVARRAEGIAVPELSAEERILAGASDYDAMCAGCHGAPGRERSAIGQGLSPQPPELDHAVDHFTAAELFWVTKHGIRMTGMPAWGITHEDEDLWSVVSFLLQLPELDAQAYQDLLDRAEAAHSGHHGSHGQDQPGLPES